MKKTYVKPEGDLIALNLGEKIAQSFTESIRVSDCVYTVIDGVMYIQNSGIAGKADIGVGNNNHNTGLDIVAALQNGLVNCLVGFDPNDWAGGADAYWDYVNQNRYA